MKVCAVVVNYRTARKTIESLAPLLQDLASLDARVLIIDNASSDGSEEELRSHIEQRNWSHRVQVVQSGRNGGFGFGNNVGIRQALGSETPPSYILFINPDAYPEPGTCRALVEFMDANPKAGIAGTAIRGIDGALRRSAFRFPTIFSEFEGTARLGLVTRLLRGHVAAPPNPALTARTDWVSGSCMMIRRKMLEKIGMFDERFFLYFEEIDLCRRAWRNDWKIFWVKDACIVHDAGYATGINNVTRPRPAYWFESRRHYFLKNHGKTYLWAANTAWLAGSGIWKVRRIFARQPSREPPRLVRDFIRHSF